MNKDSKITINNLLFALLFLVLGLVLLTTSNDIISIISKIIGVILIIIGLVKSIIYIYMKGKVGTYSLTDLLIGIIIICFGSTLILYSEAFGFAIRIIVGLWTLFAGVNRMIYAITIKSLDVFGFRTYLTSSFIMIIVGILLIINIFDKIVGLLIIIYAVSEIIDYIYYKSKNRGVSQNIVKSRKNNKKIKKIKSTKVVDAIVEEDK